MVDHSLDEIPLNRLESINEKKEKGNMLNSKCRKISVLDFNFEFRDEGEKLTKSTLSEDDEYIAYIDTPLRINSTNENAFFSPKKFHRSYSCDGENLHRDRDLIKNINCHENSPENISPCHRMKSCFYPKPDLERLRKISEAHVSDLDKLKETAIKLKLDPHYMRFSKLDYDSLLHKSLSSNSNDEKNQFTKTDCEKNSNYDFKKLIGMETVLNCLKSEIMNMQLHDYALAKQFLRLREEMNKFRLQRCYIENKELLEEAIDDDQEEELMIEKISDQPPHQFCPELKQLGLTRMNLSLRRFSVF